MMTLNEQNQVNQRKEHAMNTEAKKVETDGSNEKPAYGTKEWASQNYNLQSGCRNGCRYCYAQGLAIRFGRKNPKNWTMPEVNFSKVEQRQRKMTGRTMFPTTHDIDPTNIDNCLTVLKKMLAAGNEVLIVSKPHLECVKRLCSELKAFKGQILFRFTIGSADDKVLKDWEPGAPSFVERLDSLKWGHQEGYETSLSCEPMLDTRIDLVIEKCRPYVTDHVWLGRVNRLRQTLALNCPGDAKTKAMGEKLLAEQTDDYLRELYHRYKTDSLIRFKDSIKKVVGLERPTEKGLDV